MSDFLTNFRAGLRASGGHDDAVGRYGDDEGRWITIGASKSTNHKGKEEGSGGAAVFIKGGKITKGPPSLTGKTLDNLDSNTKPGTSKKKGPPAEKPKKATKPARQLGADRTDADVAEEIGDSFPNRWDRATKPQVDTQREFNRAIAAANKAGVDVDAMLDVAEAKEWDIEAMTAELTSQTDEAALKDEGQGGLFGEGGDAVERPTSLRKHEQEVRDALKTADAESLPFLATALDGVSDERSIPPDVRAALESGDMDAAAQALSEMIADADDDDYVGDFVEAVEAAVGEAEQTKHIADSLAKVPADLVHDVMDYMGIENNAGGDLAKAAAAVRNEFRSADDVDEALESVRATAEENAQDEAAVARGHEDDDQGEAAATRSEQSKKISESLSKIPSDAVDDVMEMMGLSPADGDLDAATASVVGGFNNAENVEDAWAEVKAGREASDPEPEEEEETPEAANTRLRARLDELAGEQRDRFKKSSAHREKAHREKYAKHHKPLAEKISTGKLKAKFPSGSELQFIGESAGIYGTVAPGMHPASEDPGTIANVDGKWIRTMKDEGGFHNAHRQTKSSWKMTNAQVAKLVNAGAVGLNEAGHTSRVEQAKTTRKTRLGHERQMSASGASVKKGDTFKIPTPGSAQGAKHAKAKAVATSDDGGLVLHKPIAGGSGWDVTHASSGMRMKTIRLKKDAMKFMKGLAGENWSRSATDIRADKEIVKRVMSTDYADDAVPYAADDEEDGKPSGGRWVTISGTHVFVTKGGKITKGPKGISGKKMGDVDKNTEKGSKGAFPKGRKPAPMKPKEARKSREPAPMKPEQPKEAPAKDDSEGLTPFQKAFQRLQREGAGGAQKKPESAPAEAWSAPGFVPPANAPQRPIPKIGKNAAIRGPRPQPEQAPAHPVAEQTKEPTQPEAAKPAEQTPAPAQDEPEMPSFEQDAMEGAEPERPAVNDQVRRRLLDITGRVDGELLKSSRPETLTKIDKALSAPIETEMAGLRMQQAQLDRVIQQRSNDVGRAQKHKSDDPFSRSNAVPRLLGVLGEKRAKVAQALKAAETTHARRPTRDKVADATRQRKVAQERQDTAAGRKIASEPRQRVGEAAQKRRQQEIDAKKAKRRPSLIDDVRRRGQR